MAGTSPAMTGRAHCRRSRNCATHGLPCPAVRATLIGFSAILMWSLLALLTVLSGRVPPFQLLSMTFAVGGLLGLVWVARARAWGVLRQPPAVWALGVGGLAGYHALYFASLRLAPPAEAGLINYLWPLLIVLFSGLLPGERLRAKSRRRRAARACRHRRAVHGQGRDAGPRQLAGLCLRLLRRLRVVGLFGAVAPLRRRADGGGRRLLRRHGADRRDSRTCLFETTVWPQDPTQWLAVLLLGIGPVGIAFYVWDIGVKRGDIRLLGVGSYAAPVLSTLFLVLAGYAPATASLGVAALLISGGGLIAAYERKKK